MEVSIEEALLQGFKAMCEDVDVGSVDLRGQKRGGSLVPSPVVIEEEGF